jgi:hypothetical protein
MNLTPRSALLPLLAALSFATGCAARNAPFDKLDKAQMTILKLQGQAPPPAPPAPAGIPGLPMIPGVPPELIQQGAQILQQGAQQLGVPLPPGLIPGTGPAAPQQPAPQQPVYNGFLIAGQTYGDADLKDDLLDLFGDKESFVASPQCQFTPGMAVIFTPSDGTPPVEVMVSMSCNQAASGSQGFMWPYPTNGFSPEARGKLNEIYMRLWGAPPPQTGG